MSQSLVHPKPVVHGMPLGVLLVLTGAVLAAHLIVLNTPGLDFAAEPPARVRALSTRTIVIPAATVAPASPTAPNARTPPRRAATPKRPSPATNHDALPPGTPAAPSGSVASAEPTQPPTPDTLPDPLAVEPAMAPEQPPEPVAELAPPRPPREDMAQAHSYAIPKSVRLRYVAESSKSLMHLPAELVWQHDGTQYQAALRVSVVIKERIDKSVGSIGPNGLRPERYSEKYKGELASHFEWEKGKIVFSANKPEAALLSGAQDQLSVSLQLVAMVAGEPRKYERGTTVTLQVAGPREASLWLFTVEGTETLDLPIEELAALKLQRIPRQQYDKTVELWLAPQYGFLPARIRITKADGETLDLKLKSVEPLD